MVARLSALALLIVLAGCSATPSASPTTVAGPSATEAATPVGSAPPAPSASAAAVTPQPTPTCPNADGGVCLGPIAAGTYTTVALEPTLTYTVPAGWGNYEDLPGNFFLLPPGEDGAGVNAGTSDYIGVYTRVAANAPGCAEGPHANVGRSPSDIATWATRQKGLVATKPKAVAIGGLTGVVLDVKLVKGWAKTCSFAPGIPDVQLITGIPPSGLDHGVIPGLTIRLYLLDFSGGTLAIEVDDVSGGSHLASYSTLIQGFRFSN